MKSSAIHSQWCECLSCKARKLRQLQNARKGQVKATGTKVSANAAKRSHFLDVPKP